VASIVHMIKFVADAKKAQQDIRLYKDEIVSAAQTVKRHEATLNGDRILKAAHDWTAAVAKFGGATKEAATNENILAGVAKMSAEMKARVNREVEKGIEQYRLLGEKAPSIMLALADATRKVEPPTSLATKAAGLLQSTFGQFTAANLAASAVQAVTAKVGEFVATGLKLPAVQQSYQRLSAGMKQDGDAMLANMTTATQGMVSNYDLMATANKAMLLGLPVTAASMGDLAKTATILGKAMGQDATKSLEDLITALGRSSPMILDNLGLTVKVGEANELYAAKLGKSAESLTDAEKKMAFYEAAMEAARRKTSELGDQSRTLGEVITAVWTQIGNVVSSVTATINTGLGRAISSTREFATFVRDAMTQGIGLATLNASLREQLSQGGGGPKRDVYLETQEHMMARLRAEAAALTAAVPPLSAANRELALSFDKGGKSAKEIADKLGVSEAAVSKTIESYKRGVKESQAFTASQDQLFGRDLITRATDYVAQLGPLSNLSLLSTGKQKELNKAAEAAIGVYARLGKVAPQAMRDLYLATYDVANQMPLLAKSSKAWAEEGVDKLARGLPLLHDNSRIVSAAVEDLTNDFFRNNLATIDAKARLDEWAKSLKASGEAAKTLGLGQSLMVDLQQLPQLLVSSFTGGGGLKGAASAMGSMLGATIGKSIGAGIKSLGKFGGPIGEALGALAGPLMEKLFSLFGNATKSAINKAFGSYDQLRGQLNTLTGAAKDAGDALWVQLTQRTGKNDTTTAARLIQEINDLFDAQKTKAADAAAATVAAQTAAIAEITDRYSEQIAELDSRWKTLNDSIGREAEEAVMGTTEIRERAERAEIEAKKAALEIQREAEINAKQESFDAMYEAGKQVDTDLAALFAREHAFNIKWNVDGAPTGGGAIPMDKGGDFITRRPTLFLASAGGGVERATFSGEGKTSHSGGGAGARGTIRQPVNVQVAGRTLLQTILEIAAEEGAV